MYNTEKQRKVKGSSKTLSRNLHKMGFWARRACRKPLISNKNRKERLDFYRSHKDWDIDKWSIILFSDESKFNLYHSDGRIRVWRQSHERYLPECTQGTVRGGGGSVLFWGVFHEMQLAL